MTKINRASALWLNDLVLTFFPKYVGNRLRPMLYRLAGFEIGQGTVIWGRIAIVGNSMVKVGDHCHINIGCTFDLTESITIGENVGFGYKVMILTSPQGCVNDFQGISMTPQPVTVGDYSWLATRSIIMPGVTIGEGAVIAAGSIVCDDVPPNTVAAGVPARVIRKLDLMKVQLNKLQARTG